MARRATAIAKGHEIADVLRKANSIPGKLKDAMSGVSTKHAADNSKSPSAS